MGASRQGAYCTEYGARHPEPVIRSVLAYAYAYAHVLQFLERRAGRERVVEVRDVRVVDGM